MKCTPGSANPQNKNKSSAKKRSTDKKPMLLLCVCVYNIFVCAVEDMHIFMGPHRQWCPLKREKFIKSSRAQVVGDAVLHHYNI